MAAADAKEQRAWMRRVATEACDPASSLIQGPLVDGCSSTHEVLLKEDGDCFTSGPTEGTVACARLLAGDWREAFRMACGETSNDWVGKCNVRMVVLPVVRAWLTQWPEKELPSNIAELLDNTLGLFTVPDEVHSRVGSRLKVALAESIPAWKPSPAAVAATVVDSCLRLVRSGIAATLENPDLESNGRAALLAAAAAEILRERRSDKAAVEFLDKLARKHRRCAEFTEALTLRWPSREHVTQPTTPGQLRESD